LHVTEVIVLWKRFTR